MARGATEEWDVFKKSQTGNLEPTVAAGPV